MSDKIALYKEGVKLKDAKDFDAAIVKLKEASEADPKFTMPLHAMAQVYTLLQRHEEAIATAKRIVEIEPDDQFSYIALSRAYQPAGMIPEAEYAMMQGQQALARAQAAKAAKG
jgi:tetratricopeptide (TPR) repeat protein